MNPITRKSPSDNAKFRENYLANLQLQATNNQKNQNANIIFKQTGAPPPTLPDYRTLTEKFADLEANRVLLRAKLSAITDGTNASQIAGSLTPDQIQFALNTWDTIEKDMKAKFKVGVPAPIFLAYLARLQTNMEAGDFVDSGLQQSSSLVPSQNSVLYTLEHSQLLTAIASLLEKGSNKFGVPIGKIVEDIRYTIHFMSHMREVLPTLPPEVKTLVFKQLEAVYNDMLAPSALPDIISSIELAINKNDKRAFERAVAECRNEFLINADQQVALRNIDRILRGQEVEVPEIENVIEEEEKEEEIAPTPQPLPFEPPPTPQPKKPISSDYLTLEDLTKKTTTRDNIAWKLYLGLRKHPDIQVRSTSTSRSGPFKNKIAVFGARAGKNGEWKSPTEADEDFSPISGVNTEQYIELYTDFLRQIDEVGGGGEAGKKKKKPVIIKEDIEGMEEEEEEAKPPKKKEGGGGETGGGGLRSHRMRGRGFANLVEKEYEKPKVYTQFGRYFINKTKLIHNGIMALRLPSGNVVPQFPTQKVSMALKDVLKMLVNGAQPSYEAVSKLTDDDRDKLVDICRVCQVDMPSIPKSKKMDKDEQDDYRFEVLRGEIMAGNNSPVIVKEFKSLLLKFMRLGRIPKREGHELLEEIVASGL